MVCGSAEENYAMLLLYDLDWPFFWYVTGDTLGSQKSSDVYSVDDIGPEIFESVFK